VHAVAGHGGERMSEQLVAQMGGVALAAALKDKPEQPRNLWLGAFGAGAQAGVPPAFLSTHPSDQTRIAKIEKGLPEAIGYYKPR
jgi:Zn-dependent protease with chaperone function